MSRDDTVATKRPGVQGIPQARPSSRPEGDAELVTFRVCHHHMVVREPLQNLAAGLDQRVDVCRQAFPTIVFCPCD